MDAIDGKQARRTGSGSNLGDVVGLCYELIIFPMLNYFFVFIYKMNILHLRIIT